MWCCLPVPVLYLFWLLIQKASLQEIQAFEGNAVILPCSNSDKVLPGTVTVLWRYRDSKAVYDTVESRASFTDQDASFRGRVSSFPDEWNKGNFSIELSSVEKTDSGSYSCFIPTVNVQTTVYLNITDRPAPVPASDESTSDGNKAEKISLLLPLLLGVHLMSFV